MIGAIIGDIVGSRFEFNNHRSKVFELFSKDCFVTDDSIMTLAIAQALMDTHDIRINNQPDWGTALETHTINMMRAIGQHYPHCGYGGRFYQWMFSKDPKPYHSYGNGAAMRVSPVAHVAGDIQALKQLTHHVTTVTHNHPEGLKGAEAVAMAIFLAKSGQHKDEIRSYMIKHYYPLDFSIDEIRKTYRFNETCQGTVPQALQAFFEATDFEDAIRTAISIGGDSDTLAAITGSIAEAYYGVPDTLREKAVSYLDDRLKVIYQAWIKYLS